MAVVYSVIAILTPVSRQQVLFPSFFSTSVLVCLFPFGEEEVVTGATLPTV